MLLEELLSEMNEELEDLNEVQMVYGRRGNKIVQMYRCTSGAKTGRKVSDPSMCGKPIDPRRRVISRRTWATKGNRLKKKRARTMRINPISKQVAARNKAKSKGK